MRVRELQTQTFMKRLYLIVIAILIAIILLLLHKTKRYEPVKIYYHTVDTVYQPYEVIKPYRVEVPIKHTTVYSEGVNGSEKVDSVIQFQIKPSELSLTLLKDSNTVLEQVYSIDPSLYKYNFTNGILTQKRILTLSPYVSASIRPFNQVYDIQGGLSYRTKHFTYRLGLNLEYTDKLQKDLIFTVQWQK